MSGTQELSWFEKLKQWLNPHAIKETIVANKGTILSALLYAGIGFLTGFVLKRYGQYLVVFIIGLCILHYVHVIQVNVYWDSIQHFLGLQQVNVQGNVFTLFWEWVRLNLVVVLSFSIGFIIGLKA